MDVVLVASLTKLTESFKGYGCEPSTITKSHSLKVCIFRLTSSSVSSVALSLAQM